MLEVVCLTVKQEAFVIFWHDVCGRSNIVRSAVESAHALHVFPHLVFAANAPGPGKVVYTLITVQIFYSRWLEETRPTDIPVRVLHMLKPCHFERVNHTVIRVCSFRHLELER